MATNVWKGGAPAVAQVQSYAFAGTWEATDIVICTVGGVSLSVVAGSTTAATIVDAIVTAWNLLPAATHPQFAEITASRSGNSLLLTADTAGVPFVCTLTTTETGGGAADDQRIEGDKVATTGTASTASAGPNDWSTAVNWSLGVAPVNTNDVIVDDPTYGIYYGLSQSGVTLASLVVKQTYANSGVIGLPRANANNYPEYREQYLCVAATLLTVGDGEGEGSGRIKINTGTVQTAANVLGSGTPLEDGIPAILLKGTHASNAYNVTKGSVGIAYFAGELSTALTLKIGYLDSIETDADVYCGSGVTLGTVTKNGGKLHCDTTTAAITAITQVAGEATISGITNVVTALTVWGGTVFFCTSGTLTTGIVGASAVLDFRRDMRAKTVTNMSAYWPNAIQDPAGIVTWTNGIDFLGCEGVAGVGTHRTWTPTAI